MPLLGVPLQGILTLPSMRKIIIPAAFLLLTVTCYGQSKRTTTPSHTKQNTQKMETTEKSAIEKLLLSYPEAINASDVAHVVSLFETDGVLMPLNAPSVQGKEQLNVTYDFLFKAVQLTIEFSIDEVIVHGDYAYARTHSKGKTLIRASGETIPVDNKELFVLHKEKGQWKIGRYMFNTNKMK